MRSLRRRPLLPVLPILCLSSVLMLSRVGRTFFKEYMLTMHHPGQSHPVTLSTHFSSHAVLSHTRFSDGFIPDFFSSMQNLYTFSITAPASSLYLYTSLAILLSEVALHVHNTSKHVFFLQTCKSRNISCFFVKAKNKK